MVERDWRYRGPHFFGRTDHGSPFHRGDFKYIILQCIKDKPSYGYEIIRALRERFFSFYAPSPGSVYPTLQMLEEMGYATGEEKEGKKVFSITEEGRKYLASKKEFIARMKGQDAERRNPDITDDIAETRRQFDMLTRLIREKARSGDSEKLGRIRKALADAYEQIAKE
jgi:DNA-binding PadR family transcriptional regulator